MTGTNSDLFTHKSSRSYLNHLLFLRGLMEWVREADKPSRKFVELINRHGAVPPLTETTFFS
jgi:hypothetical protein